MSNEKKPSKNELKKRIKEQKEILKAVHRHSREQQKEDHGLSYTSVRNAIGPNKKAKEKKRRITKINPRDIERD